MKLKKTIFILFSTFGILAFHYPAYAFRFVAYGDSREDFPEKSFNRPVLEYINSQITSLNPLPNFVCFLGDAVMQQRDIIDNYLKDWHDFMTATLMGIPLYVIVGNHDISPFYGLTSDYNLQVNFQIEFNYLPDNGPSDFYKHLVYSFEYGTGASRSLFVFLDSYIALPLNLLRYYGDYDNVQVNWFKEQVANSTAPHKFVFSHGPFFSPIGEAPYADPFNLFNGLGNSQIYYSCKDFDILFCAHEHLYSRWSLYPITSITAPQIITGTCGAPLDDTYPVPPPAHPSYKYNFVVVDIEGDNVTLHTYGVTDHGGGSFSTSIIDKVRLTK